MQAPAHLATKRRSVQPTAIGLTPPPILFSAMRVAPKKEARGGAAVLPLSTKFTKKVRDWSNTCPPSKADLLVMSFRCSGADHLGLPQSHRGRSRWLWPPRPWTPGLALVALRWTLMEHQIEGGAEDSFPVGPQVFHCLVWQYGLQKRQDKLPL